MASAAGLTTELIVEAGVALVRELGADELTMRTLAARLGVRAASLYHHIRGKEELLDLIARSLFVDGTGFQEEWDDVTSIADWSRVTAAQSDAARDFYRAHRGLASHMWKRSKTTEDATEPGWRRGEVDSLVRAGVAQPDADRLSRIQSTWTLAYLVAEEQVGAGTEDLDRLWSEGLALLHAGLETRARESLSDPRDRNGRITE